MSASNPTRFLTDASGDPRGLALKMFSSVVLEAFRLQTVFYDAKGDFVNVKSIAGQGRTEQFPILGFDPDPEYHIPGNELLGQQQPFGEVLITIDDILVSHRDVPHDQTLISHFGAVEPYAKAIGRSLAISLDSKIARMAVKAARTAALTGFHNGGKAVSRVGGGTTMHDCYPATVTGASNLRADIGALAQQFDEDNAPTDGRMGVITPYGLTVLGKDTSIFSRDFDRNDINDMLGRVIARVEGFDVVVSNGVPASNFVNSGCPTNPTKYDIDCRYVAGNVAAGTGQPIFLGMCGARDGNASVGMVIAEDFYSTMYFDERRNTTFMKGQNFVGIDVLAPYMAGVVQGQLS